MADWVAIYKFGRLAFLAIVLLGIAIYLFTGGRKKRFEEPARRMMEDDDR